jgi:hypothetical protein
LALSEWWTTDGRSCTPRNNELTGSRGYSSWCDRWINFCDPVWERPLKILKLFQRRLKIFHRFQSIELPHNQFWAHWNTCDSLLSPMFPPVSNPLSTNSGSPL